MRGVIGVATGFAVMLLIRFAPTDSLLASIVSVIGLAIVAGFVTALVAGYKEFRCAGILGILMVGLAVLAVRQRGASKPGWQEIAIGGCGPMGAFLGTALRLLTKRQIRL